MNREKNLQPRLRGGQCGAGALQDGDGRTLLSLQRKLECQGWPWPLISPRTKNPQARLKGGQCGSIPLLDPQLELLCEEWPLIRPQKKSPQKKSRLKVEPCGAGSVQTDPQLKLMCQERAHFSPVLKKSPSPTTSEWVQWTVSKVYQEKTHPITQAPVAKDKTPRSKRRTRKQKPTVDATEPGKCSQLFERGKDTLAWYGIESDGNRTEAMQFNRKMAKSLRAAGLVAKPPEPKKDTGRRVVPVTLCLRKELEWMLKMRSRPERVPGSTYLAKENRTKGKSNTKEIINTMAKYKRLTKSKKTNGKTKTNTYNNKKVKTTKKNAKAKGKGKGKGKGKSKVNEKKKKTQQQRKT